MRFNFKLITLDLTNLTNSANIAKKILSLPTREHIMRRIYPDGTFYESKVSHDKIYDALAYNATFRSEAALMVDDYVVFCGGIATDVLASLIEKIPIHSSYTKLTKLFYAS